ncbi:MAG: leucyl/phenylalanyl-tRNA--protein transferase [Acidimicrobiia bacterium]|nr:leucyl/phenylalanyl-tRNA--protein transferase [Acidimicrobiia bacterium]MDH4309219.1 leucyl/phenylalanyl-tRNA--protein transferase [Acidimicrobiia bacterium]MDH5295028.1 leucyl/phenylalanyl-tRNA--protein transferase [Acidimicrobiia bacterium]
MVPIEPPPSRFLLPDPWTAGADDVVALGGDLEPGTVLQAYRKGMFPMHIPDGSLAWWSPWRRGVLPLDGLVVSRSLRRSVRRYTVTIDAAFERVIDGCANPDRPHGWITPAIIQAYRNLHELGWVHSVECWDEHGALAGGLYGVAIGAMFCGESMFHTRRDASKVALVSLVELMRSRGGRLLDVQWVTPHLASLGAVEVSRHRYLEEVADALAASKSWLSDSAAGEPG